MGNVASRVVTAVAAKGAVAMERQESQIQCSACSRGPQTRLRVPYRSHQAPIGLKEYSSS